MHVCPMSTMHADLSWKTPSPSYCRVQLSLLRFLMRCRCLPDNLTPVCCVITGLIPAKDAKAEVGDVQCTCPITCSKRHLMLFIILSKSSRQQHLEGKCACGLARDAVLLSTAILRAFRVGIRGQSMSMFASRRSGLC